VATDDLDSTAGMSPDEELAFVWERLWFSPTVAADVTDQLDSEPTDVVVADSMLAGAFCAAERADVPVVALFHQPWSIFHAGPLSDMWREATPLVSQMRAQLGLREIAEPQELFAGRPSVVAGIPALEIPIPVPDNVHHVGPIAEHPPHPATDLPLPAGTDPLVVVSHSTSQMGQTPVLQAILDELGGLPVRVLATTGPAVDPAALTAPPNAAIVEYLPHERVLPYAAAVVTHAGHGTTLAALAHGVPLICLPLGRDQFFNAAQVESLGAGIQLAPDRAPGAVAHALDTVLADDRYSQAARRIADGVGELGGAKAAADVAVAATAGVRA
jgi:MGT family glycosyltransferase